MSQTDSVAKEIEHLEQQEAQAMRAGDISTLQKLWADDLLVNSTANLIAGKQILLEMIRGGLLRLRTYERRPVRIVPSGDLAVSTGNEVSQLITNAADYKMFVSYMNVWMKRAGNWQLVARHVGMIERTSPQSQR
ncbi:MAG TPA: nuclear transport factor 2 family protein [Patescibacteria group bacterium]|nr:nuclear transport factor 2 family protein [Patescibacteria group bacterium]